MQITVDSGIKCYDVIIKNDSLNEIGKIINLDRKVLVVTDSGVPKKYSEIVMEQSRRPVLVTVEQGEKNKNPENFLKILSAMLENSFTRKDCVVAVGGGVVGDMSGFAAACYMRGVDFYNIPTTLLSQIDSSIGGKTAVDFNGVKNAIGAFHHPKKVVIDPTVLQTLDGRQLHAGLAEAVKMAATNDSDLFEMIEKSESLEKDLPNIIEKALLIKKDVVEKDPDEKGLRRVLNFGHTLGHAVESAEKGKLLHGECVAVGMVSMCGKTARERIISVLEKYELPINTECTDEELLPYLIHDKKATCGKINVVYVPEIGSFEFREMTPENILRERGVLR